MLTIKFTRGKLIPLQIQIEKEKKCFNVLSMGCKDQLIIIIQRLRSRNTEDVAFESNSNTSCSWGIRYDKEKN